jgi:hypothetical protein
MGFPFLAPLKQGIVKKLRERESNIEYLNSLSPFIMLSSANVVTKTGIPFEEIVKNQDYSNSFLGCVVANTTDVKNLYQTGKTIVGYDLNGTPIEVEGETNRRISTPIITQMELDTDGSNNTLKVAQLQIKVFSLKQLEMFELFFLRPATKVVVEWGWNSDIRNKTNNYIIGSKLFAKKKFTDYVNAYMNIFSHTDNAYQKAKAAYLQTISDTNYEYDYMAGMVTNYTFSPQEDGTYDVMLEVSAGNELQLWMPIKQAKTNAKGSKTSNDPKVTGFQSWVSTIAANVNEPQLISKINQKDDINEFFNWGVVNQKQEDSKLNKDAYISFRLIIKILNNIVVYKESENNLKIAYTLDGQDIIPVNSSPYIISTTPDFILPGQLPSIKVVTDSDNKEKIIIKEDERVDMPINGYSFNISNQKQPTDVVLRSKTPPGETPSNETYSVSSNTGNLLNVFFKWDTFVNFYSKAYSQADIVNSLIGLFNDNMFGLCKLEIGKPDDVSSSASTNTIIDTKLQTPPPTSSPSDEMYRFKIGAFGSITKEFSFNMELDALAQSQALYSTQLTINNIKNDTSQSLETETNASRTYKNANNFRTPNIDGYYSINAIEIKLVEDSEKWNAVINPSGSVTQIEAVGDGEKEKENMNEILSQNFIKFKLSNDSKTSGNNLIYTDASLIQSTIVKQPKRTTALTFLEITLAIDGIAGLSAGEYFHIDGIPEIYNRNGYFQITNIKHGLDETGWKTTIVAGYRIEVKE